MAAIMAGCLAAASPAVAQTTTGTTQKPTLKLEVPTSPIRLLAANCLTNCWLSGLVAPAVLRENASPVTIRNASAVDMSVTARFVPTNGLALTHLAADGNGYLMLMTADATNTPLWGESVPLRAAETVTWQLAADPSKGGAWGASLPAGGFAGQLQLVAASPGADTVVQAVPIDMRVRASAAWAVLAVLAGILTGRLAQLVYDPKVMARLQLLDWLREIRGQIDRLSDADLRQGLLEQLRGLERRLHGRGGEAAILQPEVERLEQRLQLVAGEDPEVARLAGEIVGRADATALGVKLADARRLLLEGNATGAAAKLGEVEATLRPPPPAAIIPGPPQAPAPPAPPPHLSPLDWLKRLLRGLAGASALPLPLSEIYDWVLPLLVVVTLLVLTLLFVWQQYGAGGAAETFGAGGIADYAALFLAGVASEAVAKGLQSIKWAAAR